MKITNLKDKLRKGAPEFGLPRLEDLYMAPASEIGYIRADYDGYRWWSTVFPIHVDLATDELRTEFDAMFDAFIRSFRDLRVLDRWLVDNAHKIDDHYYAFYEGRHGVYELRMTPMKGDYNLYLHGYSKAAMEV